MKLIVIRSNVEKAENVEKVEIYEQYSLRDDFSLTIYGILIV